ncbi:MAG: hypothetical protein CJBNEKGG_00374 [Prosthecobacter sp.]|nr:hypothetical protein [Prosthecobacter sp.]
MIEARITNLALLVLTVPLFGAPPPELAALKLSFEKAKQQAVSPLEKKYSDALTALKVRFTKEGNLEAALEVDAELKALVSSQSIAQPATSATQATSPPTPGLKTQQVVRGDFAYTLVHAEVSWKEAVDACRQMGGDLAAFESWSEWERVYRLFSAPAEDQTVWIGGWRTEGTSGPWQWNDTTAVSKSILEKIGYNDKLERSALRADIKGGGITADKPHFRRGYICKMQKKK